MSVPSYLIYEALQRLSDAPVRTLIKKAGIDPDAVPGPEPDVDEMRRRYASMGEPTDAGAITVEASLSLFGVTVPAHFRITYAGEFGHYPGEFEGFARLGVTQKMEVLLWGMSDDPVPEWCPISIGILSREMLEAVDDLILKQVVESRGQTFL